MGGYEDADFLDSTTDDDTDILDYCPDCGEIEEDCVCDVEFVEFD